MERAQRPTDPRQYQILVLSSLLCWGVLQLQMPVEIAQIAATFTGALVAQVVASRAVGVPLDLRSPIITSLGLCLLLRTNDPSIAALAGFVAIGAKFLFRVRGKHLFNPAMFGLVVAVQGTGQAWISPGQWGSVTWFAMALACAGLFVTFRSARSDITLFFLMAWSAVLFGRAAWLGDPWAIPLHQLENGAVLIFAFFMISDPKTTPDSRWARLAYACGVAAVAGFITFGLWRESGLIWALFLLSPAVPLLDALIRAPRFAWPGTTATRLPAPQRT